MILYMYIALGPGADSPPVDKVLMTTEMFYHFICCKFKKKSLWNRTLYILFYDLIHVYSPRAGGIEPSGSFDVDRNFVTSVIYC